MKRDRPDSSSSSASQAMNTVLKAEQDAEQDIAECLKMARKRVEEAQQQAAIAAGTGSEAAAVGGQGRSEPLASCSQGLGSWTILRSRT